MPLLLLWKYFSFRVVHMSREINASLWLSFENSKVLQSKECTRETEIITDSA